MIDLNNAPLQEEISFSDETVVKSLNIKLAEYNLMRAEENSAKSEYELLKLQRETMEETIYNIMEDAGMNAIKTDDGTFYRRVDTYCSIRKEEQQKAFEWLIENGLGDIIQETVNARTLTATMKERLDSGEQIPEFINVTTKNRVGIRH